MTTETMRNSSNKTDNESANNGRQEAEDEGPACQSCRKKKSKCSRQQPCSQCKKMKIECLYDDKKIKPGLKTGIVEALSQRVDSLEKMFLGQSLLLQQVIESSSSSTPSLLTPSSPQHVDGPSDQSHQVTLKDKVQKLKRNLMDTVEKYCASSNSSAANWGDPPAKRCRRNSVSTSPRQQENGSLLTCDPYLPLEPALPSNDLINSLVDDYFVFIHPWIPVLHRSLFTDRINDPQRRQDLGTKLLLHAIVSICVRFSKDSRLVNNVELQRKYSMSSRQYVILQSMDAFSTESLEALIIVAFDTIGSGRGPSSWSVVGSMTRTVEHLQLSFEDEDEHSQKGNGEFLIRRIAFLNPPSSWSESEERRRVFWNVFLMDRFCSVATGWNTSLNSTDVRRRLPCEGCLWEAGAPVKTPFFGIADKSQSVIDMQNGLATSMRQLTTDEELEAIGGFAYSIEATESLSLVTNFFLRQAVDLQNPQELQLWLIRFKELDLRLVQWKLFLPPKWATAKAENGHMDPNLCLAHITHNTSVILLHQSIAFPSPQWKTCPINLPSACSAETCLTAACEISTIAAKFLECHHGPASPQFSFCLFIASRVLLAHSSYTKTPIRPELNTLIRTLMELAHRWSGSTDRGEDASENLASQFAVRLMRARNCRVNPLDIQKPAYSDDTADETRSCEEGQQRQQLVEQQAWSEISQTSPSPMSLAFPPLPPSFQQLNQSPYPSIPFSSLASINEGEFDVVTHQPNVSGDWACGSTKSMPQVMHEGVPMSKPGLTAESPDDISVAHISDIFADREFLELDRVLMYGGDSNAINGVR